MNLPPKIQEPLFLNFFFVWSLINDQQDLKHFVTKSLLGGEISQKDQLH